VSYLIDTHTFLWFILDDPQLSDVARIAIEENDATVFLSIASVWEIAIKHSLGKLPLPEPFSAFIPVQLQQNAITLLGISVEHTARVAILALHHRDPFDRLLIAQSLVEKIPIISADSAFDAYGIQRIW
jgi:PIN domain nuclease of toxin-antitoxin system